jgi:hypothetical protein
MTFAMSGHDFSTMFFGTVGHLIFRQMPMIIGNQEKIQELHQKGPTKKTLESQIWQISPGLTGEIQRN